MTKCKICRTEYDKRFVSQKTCGDPICKQEQKRQEALERTRRADIRKRLAALKTKPEMVKEVDAIFSKYIRYRDRHQKCICCNMPLNSSGSIPTLGGDYDAGHYVTRGNMATRWDEMNVHAQRKHCNRYEGGNYIGFRKGLIARIGLEEVERLEALKGTIRKFTMQEMEAIRDYFKNALKKLKEES